jgi:hypothetical protein
MEKNKLDTLFRSALSTRPVVPDERAWTRLEARLDKKRGILIWKYVGATAAAVLIFAMVWMGYVDEIQQTSEGARISNISDGFEEQHGVELETKSPETSSVAGSGTSLAEHGKETKSGQLSGEPALTPEAAVPSVSDADVQLAQVAEDRPTAKEPVVSDDAGPSQERDPLPPENEMAPEGPADGQLAWSSDDQVPIRIVYKKGRPGSGIPGRKCWRST